MSVTVRPAQLPQDHAEIARLCWAYRDLLIERTRDLDPPHSGIVEHYYGAPGYAALIDDLPRIHARPRGRILLAETGDGVIGCAMYYPLAPDLTEIKRVYVDPAARGAGAGRALMQAGMDHARADGYGRMVLDTIATLTEAIALYEAMGFAPARPFYTPEPDYADLVRFFGRDL